MDEITVNGTVYVPKGSQQENEGEFYIVRAQSGVFMAKIAKRGEMRDGFCEMDLVESRRIWKWSGATETSQLARDGVSDPDNCKVTPPSTHTVFNVVEIYPMTEQAVQSISEVKSWTL